jgi:hypothetical protein
MDGRISNAGIVSRIFQVDKKSPGAARRPNCNSCFLERFGPICSHIPERIGVWIRRSWLSDHHAMPVV